MTAASGQVLDLALVELGWPELLAAFPGVAVPLAFGLLGETGAHAPLLNDVIASCFFTGTTRTPMRITALRLRSMPNTSALTSGGSIVDAAGHGCGSEASRVAT